MTKEITGRDIIVKALKKVLTPEQKQNLVHHRDRESKLSCGDDAHYFEQPNGGCITTLATSTRVPNRYRTLPNAYKDTYTIYDKVDNFFNEHDMYLYDYLKDATEDELREVITDVVSRSRRKKKEDPDDTGGCDEAVSGEPVEQEHDGQDRDRVPDPE